MNVVTIHGPSVGCPQKLALMNVEEIRPESTGQQESQKVVVWGAGGHALVVVDLILQVQKYSLEGILLEEVWWPTAHARLRDLILGGREQVEGLARRGVRQAVVAVGDNNARLEIAGRLRSAGMNLPPMVSPSALVSSSATIGAGSVILSGAMLNAESKVGCHCIINTGAIIEHECVLEDGVHISPGAVLCGKVRVGHGTWIGAGATVIDKVTIGAGSIIGAGSVVVEDLPANVVAMGVPARVRRILTVTGPDNR